MGLDLAGGGVVEVDLGTAPGFALGFGLGEPVNVAAGTEAERRCGTCAHWMRRNGFSENFQPCAKVAQSTHQNVRAMVACSPGGVTGRLWTRRDFGCTEWKERES